VKRSDGSEEMIEAGDVYYLEPGHVPVFEDIPRSSSSVPRRSTRRRSKLRLATSLRWRTSPRISSPAVAIDRFHVYRIRCGTPLGYVLELMGHGHRELIWDLDNAAGHLRRYGPLDKTRPTEGTTWDRR
jgi:hypothetical protein